MRRHFAIGFIVAFLFAATTSAQTIALVQSIGYRSALALVSRGPAADVVIGPTADVPNCYASVIHVPAGGAVYVYDFLGKYTCSKAAIVTMPAPAGVDSFVDVFFDDGKSKSCFSLAPFGTLVGHQRFGPVVSDDLQGTWANLFASGSAWATITIYDGAGAQVKQELIDFKGFLQYEIKSRPGVAFVDIASGWPGFPSTTPIKGFLTTGKRDGGSDRVLAFVN